MFKELFGAVNNRRIDDLTQLLGKVITRVDELEIWRKNSEKRLQNTYEKVHALTEEVAREKQMRINNERVLVDLSRQVYELNADRDAIYSFVKSLSTTGLTLKLAATPVDDANNPDGAIAK